MYMVTVAIRFNDELVSGNVDRAGRAAGRPGDAVVLVWFPRLRQSRRSYPHICI